jgi:hypothetical protein
MYYRRRSKHFQLSRLVFIMNLIYTFSTFPPLECIFLKYEQITYTKNVGKQNFRIYQPIMLYSICSFVRYFLKGILCYINDSICSCTWKQLILYVKLYVSKIYYWLYITVIHFYLSLLNILQGRYPIGITVFIFLEE